MQEAVTLKPNSKLTKKSMHIIYSIFKKTVGCHALILLNWQYWESSSYISFHVGCKPFILN
jgi:hypothetical protein